MVTAKLANRGLFLSTVTYMSVHGSRSVILKGGESMEIENTSSTSNPDLPDNILNLPAEDSDINKNDFKYDKDNISIKITQN